MHSGSIDDQIRIDQGDITVDQAEEEIKESSSSDFFKTLLTCETGEGALENYIDHPMNFNNSKAMARILRGGTGMFGALNLAVIDIIVGLLDLVTKKGDNNHNATNGGFYTS